MLCKYINRFSQTVTDNYYSVWFFLCHSIRFVHRTDVSKSVHMAECHLKTAEHTIIPMRLWLHGNQLFTLYLHNPSSELLSECSYNPLQHFILAWLHLFLFILRRLSGRKWLLRPSWWVEAADVLFMYIIVNTCTCMFVSSIFYLVGFSTRTKAQITDEASI